MGVVYARKKTKISSSGSTFKNGHMGAPGGGGPGITMAELLWSLQDSQLVARFQRRCGLFPAPDEGPSEPCAGPTEGAAWAPGLGHLPVVKGRGAGEAANELRRVAVPQHQKLPP